MLLGYVRVSTNHQETGTRAAGALSDRLENQAVGKKGFKCGGLLAGHTPTLATRMGPLGYQGGADSVLEIA